MKVVEVIDVWKSYGKVIANEGVSLTVNKNEIVSVLGPNGAGKTTLLKQVYGILEPDRGEIRVFGRRPKEVRRLMGVLPQEVSPYYSLTVYENLYYIGRIKGVEKGVLEERIKELLDLFGLDGKKLAMDLSGGMKRKLLLAMAIINDPELLVLDEPTVGLDPESRREVWDLLMGMKREGKSIIITTHYLDEAERLSDRIYFLNRKVLFSGTPSEIKSKFSSWYEVIDYSEGKVYRVSREEVKKLLANINGDFEVRMPSLEDVYLEVFRGK